MNYKFKRIAVGVALLFLYFIVLYNHEEIVNRVLQLVGSFYVGTLIYDVAVWLFPKEAS